MNRIVVANWKMNPPTMREAKKLFEATKKAAESAKGVSVIVAPPALFLRELSSLYKGKRLAFAIQNASAEPDGAFTGETSLAQARDAKAAYVLVGHAERRALGESDEDTKRKVLASLSMKLTPILCIGESVRSSDGAHFGHLARQLRIALGEVAPAKVTQVIVAYEPLWAIGAPKPMSPSDMHETAIFIRKTLVESHGAPAMNIRILYGGSIDESNAAEMIERGDVNGLLVGRASTDAAKISALVAAL